MPNISFHFVFTYTVFALKQARIKPNSYSRYYIPALLQLNNYYRNLINYREKLLFKHHLRPFRFWEALQLKAVQAIVRKYTPLSVRFIVHSTPLTFL